MVHLKQFNLILNQKNVKLSQSAVQKTFCASSVAIVPEQCLLRVRDLCEKN